jgi:outer membrane protein
VFNFRSFSIISLTLCRSRMKLVSKESHHHIVSTQSLVAFTNITRLPLLILASALTPEIASAQQQATTASAADAHPALDAAVGAGALMLPEYEGATKLRLLPLPAISVTWRNTVFLNIDDGLGVYAVNNDRFTLGGGVTYGIGRSEDRGPRLRGMGDIRDAARPRVFGRVYAGPAYVGASISRDLGGSDGLLGDLAVGLSTRLSSRLQLRFGASASFADGKYMRAFFGVSPEQAARSGLPAYAPNAGVKRADATAGLTFALSRHWSIGANAGIGRLLGDAARSPVVERKWQPTGTALLSFHF